MTNTNRGSRIYSMVGIMSYVVTTIISAFLNIYLFMNLDSSWKYFTLALSLSLEVLKAFTLIRANTYRSLREYMANCKFDFQKVTKKMFVYYGFYVFFAVLSLTAGLMFSLTISDKTEQNFSIQKQEITQNIQTITESKTAYDKAYNEYNTYYDTYDEDVKIAKQTMRDAQDKYDTLSQQWDTKQRELTPEEFSKWKADVDYKKVKNDAADAKEDYEDLISGKTLSRKQKTMEDAKADYDSKVALFGGLNELNLQLADLNKQELAAAGSSKGFILLAQTFGIPDKANKIKFVILLLASFLVEVGIWISSPDLRLDSSLLYSFRNDIGLSNKKDVEKLLKEIEDSNTRYSVKKEPEKPKVVEVDSPKTLKEMENLREQIASLERERDSQKEIIDELSNPLDEIAWENMMEEHENDQSIIECEIEAREKAESDLARAETAIVNANKIIKKEREDSEELNKNYWAWHDRCISFEDENKKLKEEIQKKDSIIADLDERPVQDENKKYTEDDVKKAIQKAMKKSKDKITDLQKAVDNWETNYNTLSEKASNLELANKSLENRLQETTAEKEIDQVLKGEITDSEIDQVLEENKKSKKQEIVIKSAEDQINDMLGLTNDTKTVKIDV